MTREEQIEMTSLAYGCVGSGIDFEAGAKWADANPKSGLIDLSQVWHDASEEPKLKAWCIVQIDENAFDTFIMAIDKNGSWAKWSRSVNITRWAYIKDLLPKGGEQ